MRLLNPRPAWATQWDCVPIEAHKNLSPHIFLWRPSFPRSPWSCFPTRPAVWLPTLGFYSFPDPKSPRELLRHKPVMLFFVAIFPVASHHKHCLLEHVTCHRPHRSFRVTCQMRNSFHQLCHLSSREPCVFLSVRYTHVIIATVHTRFSVSIKIS